MTSPIFVTLPSWTLSGVSVASANLVRALRARGHDARLVITASRYPDSKPLPPPVDLPLEYAPLDPRTSWRERWRRWSSWLVERSPCVYVPNHDYCFSPVTTALPASVRVIGIAHADNERVYQQARELGPSWNAIVAVSELIARELERRVAHLQGRVWHIPNGVQVARDFSPHVPAATRELRCAYVGRLAAADKRVLDLVPIVDGALARGVPIQLDIYGAGPDEQHLRARAARLIDRGAIRLHGSIAPDRVPSVLEQHDVLLSTSETEGLPMNVLEAMANGCVVVASDTRGGLPELIDDGVEGFRVPIGEVGAFVSRLERLARDESLRQTLSAAAHRKVREHFSLEQLGMRWEALLNRVHDAADAGTFARTPSPSPWPDELGNLWRDRLPGPVRRVGRLARGVVRSPLPPRQRVLVWLPYFSNGGAERQGALLARHLARSGRDVEVWGFPGAGAGAPIMATLEAWGIKTRVLSTPPRFDWTFSRAPLGPGRALRQYAGWPLQLLAYGRELPAGRFDTVVPFTPWPSLVATLLKKRFGARQVIWNHRGGYDAAGIDYTPFLVDAVRAAHPTFVANSRSGASFLEDVFYLPRGHVRILRNAFEADDDGRPHQRPASTEPTDTMHLVQLANWYPEKDPQTLLLGVAHLHATGVRCHLHLAGQFPSERRRAELEELVSSAGMQDYVTLYGGLGREAARALLARAHVGVLSSRSEGTPNSVMEYMHAGLAVVATDLPGIRDLVGTEAARWLFPVGDHERLGGLLVELARDSALRARVGEVLGERLHTAYSPESVFAEWDALLSAAGAPT